MNVQKDIQTRYQLPELLNALGFCGVGVEVGVQEGLFSEHFLQRWCGRLLLSVDCWTEQPKGVYLDASNVSQSEQERLYRATLQRLGRYGAKSQVWRMFSADAAQRVPNRSLDFCYLDARHDYQGVMDDLTAWFPKMRSGSLMAGHDYVHAFPGFQVKAAVTRFFAPLGMTIHVIHDTIPAPGYANASPSWFVLIP